jgi:hypothetical protein
LWRCCGLAPRGYFSQGMMKALHIGLHRERQLAGIIGYAVARLDGDPVAFGGIWEEWESPADETLRYIRHDQIGDELCPLVLSHMFRGLFLRYRIDRQRTATLIPRLAVARLGGGAV